MSMWNSDQLQYCLVCHSHHTTCQCGTQTNCSTVSSVTAITWHAQTAVYTVQQTAAKLPIRLLKSLCKCVWVTRGYYCERHWFYYQLMYTIMVTADWKFQDVHISRHKLTGYTVKIGIQYALLYNTHPQLNGKIVGKYYIRYVLRTRPRPHDTNLFTDVNCLLSKFNLFHCYFFYTN